MVEVASDIKQQGWFKDCDGIPENADLCAWTFDRVYQSNDGSHYNMQLGSKKFLIQANWALRYFHNDPKPFNKREINR